MRQPAVVLALAAFVLLSPSLLLGTQLSDSASLNLNWAGQFADQFRAGILYPRWMPRSFDSLGSPAFYFYAPLPFWLDALVSVVTDDALAVSYRLVVSWVLILWLSGLAMHAWLKAETANGRMALVGALLYMAAPYHLLDHYVRGAYAEFSAFALVPVVMLALNRIAGMPAQRIVGAPVRGVVLLAVGYAALLMSHLPTALLASATVFPAYVVWRVRRPVPLLVGGALGLGLAAAYVVPALLLQEWISAEWLWSAFYRVDAWFLLTPGQWPDAGLMLMIAALAACYVAVAVAIAVHQRRVGIWTGLTFGCLALIAGLVPWFWQLPQLAKVQFPWRLMAIVEFTIITAFCAAPVVNARRSVLLCLAIAAVAALQAEVSIVSTFAAEVALTREHTPIPLFDTREYTPNGYSEGHGDPANPDRRHLPTVPVVACAPVVPVCQATERRFGDLDIEIQADVPTTVVLHRFFFPAWRLEPALSIAANEPFKLVSFTAPPGRHAWHLARTMLSEEKVGWATSGASLLLLLGWAAAARRRARPA